MTGRPLPRRGSRRAASRNQRQAPKADLIADPSRIEEIAERLSAEPIVAFDTEFLREKTFFPQLGLLQIADREQVWLIDPLAIPAERMRPLIEVFRNPSVLKVAHAAEQDQECLFHDYGAPATPLLDTSIAAALCGLGDQIGLAGMLRKTVGADLPKTHTRTNWLKRPLPQAMLDYAAADVFYLVEAAEQLLGELKSRGRREWAMALSARLADPDRFQADGLVVARRVAANARLTPRNYAVLKELAGWRERRARAADIPRRWLADDQTLVQLARAQPGDAEQLADFRGLGARVRTKGAQEILAAVREGRAVPEDSLEEPPRKLEPTPEEAPALTLFKCFISSLAQQHGAPPRYLIENDAALLLLRGRFSTAQELRRSGLLEKEAWDLFGEEILAILKGDKALKLDHGRALRFAVDAPRG